MYSVPDGSLSGPTQSTSKDKVSLTIAKLENIVEGAGSVLTHLASWKLMLHILSGVSQEAH